MLPLALLFAVWPHNLLAQQDEQDPAQAPQGQQYIQQTPEQLQQLVAPIALYPDSLVAEILAAAAFPEHVVEADQWENAHPDLKGEALAQAVDQQPWDASVKALTAFPSVLGNKDRNLSWTSSLGDAYYNQQQNVMDAIQEMRQRAQKAGNLKTSPEQTVTSEDSTIIIEPAGPEVVCVPAYDPWLVYGGPVEAWPGWYNEGNRPPNGNPGAAEIPSVPAQRPGLLKETTRLHEDTLEPSVRAVRTRAPSAATTMAERQGAFRRAEVPASAAEQRVVAAVSRIGNRRIVMFLVACKI